MILANTASVLLNKESSFYYCGIEISKDNFDIKEFVSICDRINDLKHNLFEEKNLSSARKDAEILGAVYLNDQYDCVCNVYKEKVFLGLYNTQRKEIVPVTNEVLKYFTDGMFAHLSYELNKTSKLAQKEVLKPSVSGVYSLLKPVKDKLKVIAFNNYKQHVEKLSSCFYHTYELEFVNGYRDYVLTDEQLKHSLEEK